MTESATYEQPSYNIDDIDFLLENQNSAEIREATIEEAALNFGLYPDSPLLSALGGGDMKWQRMKHPQTKAELFMGSRLKGEFGLNEALITMALPKDKKRLPGNRIAGVLEHPTGTRQVLGLDFDTHDGRLQRIGFSDPRPGYEPHQTYSFSQPQHPFQATEIGSSFMTAGIFTDAMIAEADASSHLTGELVNYGLNGSIVNSLTSTQLAHYDMDAHNGFLVLRNSVWQMPAVIPQQLG